MKLYLIALILLGCTVSIRKSKQIKIWSISTSYIENESVFQDTIFSDSKLNLAESIYIERYFLDSNLNTFPNSNYRKSFSTKEIVFQNTASRKYFFQNDTINVYKIYWNKDATEYNDFSSFILYTKEYGIVYKSFRKKGKEFFKWRLLNIKYPENQLPALNDFTYALLKDTLFFEKPIIRPKQ